MALTSALFVASLFSPTTSKGDLFSFLNMNSPRGLFLYRYQGMVKGYSGVFRLGEATSTWDADSPVCTFKGSLCFYFPV